MVESADLVDAGVIFGTGFAPFRGGPLHYKAAQIARRSRASRRRRVTFEPKRQDEMQRFLRRVAVIGGARIPFCRSNTFYADLSNLDLMTGALNALVDRYNLKGQHIDEVVGGAVVTHSKDFNLTREARARHRLAPSTPGITHDAGVRHQPAGRRWAAAAKIATGEIECAIAVGSDTTSDAPIVVLEEARAAPGQAGPAEDASWTS